MERLQARRNKNLVSLTRFIQNPIQFRQPHKLPYSSKTAIISYANVLFKRLFAVKSGMLTPEAESSQLDSIEELPQTFHDELNTAISNTLADPKPMQLNSLQR